MKLSAGTTSPNFETQDIYGNPVRLSDYRGKKIVLGFFRNVNCPFCNMRVHQQLSPIPLIGDPEKRVYKQWGVENSMMKTIKTMFSSTNRQAMKEGQQLDLPKEKDKGASMTLIPADFLIDEKGVIQKAHYGHHLNDHIELQEISDFVFKQEKTAV
jgi:peroxiredoxin Q/BCP